MSAEKKMPPLTDDQRLMAQENVKLVYTFMNQHRVPIGWDAADFEGELMRSLCRAVQSYDASIGAFSTYAFRCFERQRIRMYRHWYAKMRLRSKTKTLNEIWLNYVSAKNSNPVDAAIDSDMQNYARRLIKLLPQRYQKFILQCVDGRTFADIGREHGIHRERVRQIFNKSINMLRRHVEAS